MLDVQSQILLEKNNNTNKKQKLCRDTKTENIYSITTAGWSSCLAPVMAVSKPNSALRYKASAIWYCARLASSGCMGIFVSAEHCCSPPKIPLSLGVAVRSKEREEIALSVCVGWWVRGWGEYICFVVQRHSNGLLSWRNCD